MTRIKIKGGVHAAQPEHAEHPDFYRMPPLVVPRKIKREDRTENNSSNAATRNMTAGKSAGDNAASAAAAGTRPMDRSVVRDSIMIRDEEQRESRPCGPIHHVPQQPSIEMQIRLNGFDHNNYTAIRRKVLYDDMMMSYQHQQQQQNRQQDATNPGPSSQSALPMASQFHPPNREIVVRHEHYFTSHRNSSSTNMGNTANPSLSTTAAITNPSNSGSSPVGTCYPRIMDDLNTTITAPQLANRPFTLQTLQTQQKLIDDILERRLQERRMLLRQQQQQQQQHEQQAARRFPPSMSAADRAWDSTKRPQILNTMSRNDPAGTMDLNSLLARHAATISNSSNRRDPNCHVSTLPAAIANNNHHRCDPTMNGRVSNNATTTPAIAKTHNQRDPITKDPPTNLRLPSKQEVLSSAAPPPPSNKTNTQHHRNNAHPPPMTQLQKVQAENEQLKKKLAILNPWNKKRRNTTNTNNTASDDDAIADCGICQRNLNSEIFIHECSGCGISCCRTCKSFYCEECEMGYCSNCHDGVCACSHDNVNALPTINDWPEGHHINSMKCDGCGNMAGLCDKFGTNCRHCDSFMCCECQKNCLGTCTSCMQLVCISCTKAMCNQCESIFCKKCRDCSETPRCDDCGVACCTECAPMSCVQCDRVVCEKCVKKKNLNQCSGCKQCCFDCCDLTSCANNHECKLKACSKCVVFWNENGACLYCAGMFNGTG